VQKLYYHIFEALKRLFTKKDEKVFSAGNSAEWRKSKKSSIYYNTIICGENEPVRKKRKKFEKSCWHVFHGVVL